MLNYCVSKIIHHFKTDKTTAEREWMYTSLSHTQAPSNDWIENTGWLILQLVWSHMASVLSP